jgi:hypothetical protein
MRYLLCDHPAERVTGQIHWSEANRIGECRLACCHPGHAGGYLTRPEARGSVTAGSKLSRVPHPRGPGDARFTSLHDQQGGAFDQFGAAESGRRNRNKAISSFDPRRLILVIVDNQRGTSMRATSLQKSSCQVETQASFAVADAAAEMLQLA